MTLKYRIEEFKLPKDGTLQTRQKIRIVKGNRVTLDDLSSRIANACSLTETDVIAVTKALSMQIKSELLRGNTIDLGDLGTPRLRANNRQHTFEEGKKINRKLPPSVRLHYENRKLLKELLPLVEFKKERQQRTLPTSSVSERKTPNKNAIEGHSLLLQTTNKED